MSDFNVRFYRSDVLNSLWRLGVHLVGEKAKNVFDRGGFVARKVGGAALSNGDHLCCEQEKHGAETKEA